MDFKQWQDENENRLMDLWDTYKYEELCGEHFHYDNVDYFDEDKFNEMCYDIYTKEQV